MAKLTDGFWKHCRSAAEADPRDARVKKVNWTGPGWYYIRYYQQRCPRNCCYDSVVDAEPAAEFIETVRSEMIVLASLLKDAKEKT